MNEADEALADVRRWMRDNIGDGDAGEAFEMLSTLSRCIGKIKSESDILRDIVRMYASYVDDDRCEGCVCKRACNDGMVEKCWQLTEIRRAEKMARELGIEV